MRKESLSFEGYTLRPDSETNFVLPIFMLGHVKVTPLGFRRLSISLTPVQQQALLLFLYVT